MEAFSENKPWAFLNQDASQPCKIRLFCFPFVGRDATVYRSWSKCLPKEVDVRAVDLPGGMSNPSNEKSFEDIGELAAVFIKNVNTLLTQPFAFFGHSMGALLSFEIASQLHEQKNANLQHLFVSGWRAPGLKNPHPIMHTLSDSKFLDELVRRYKGIAASFQKTELLSALLPGLKSSVKMSEIYEMPGRGTLSCPITAFGAWQDALVRTDEIRAWRDLTTSSFRMHMFKGDHFFIESLSEQLLKIIADDLESCLLPGKLC